MRISLTLTALLCFAQLSLAAPASKIAHVPLIIMGGHWTPDSEPRDSDLSRVCNVGFTHIYSYDTEAVLTSKVTLKSAVDTATNFFSTVKSYCPHLGIVMGVPRSWIYDDRIDLVERYIKALEKRHVVVDYWYSDEMINQMVSHGMTLKDAERRARETIGIVNKMSAAPYIWAEPGNYNSRLHNILNILTYLPAGIKSYDEYIISKTGRLAQSRAGFNSMLSTLTQLKSKGSLVFPIDEINFDKKKDMAPSEGELAAISVAQLMQGANGFMFYEERYTTPDILLGLTKIIKLLKLIDNIGVKKFIRTKDAFAAWKTTNSKQNYVVVLNTMNRKLSLVKIRPLFSSGIWATGVMKGKLMPMGLLVYSE